MSAGAMAADDDRLFAASSRTPQGNFIINREIAEQSNITKYARPRAQARGGHDQPP